MPGGIVGGCDLRGARRDVLVSSLSLRCLVSEMRATTATG